MSYVYYNLLFAFYDCLVLLISTSRYPFALSRFPFTPSRYPFALSRYPFTPSRYPFAHLAIPILYL